MTVKDIYNFIDKIAPFDTACDFDNAGLLIGNENAEVTGALACLDCTDSAVQKALELNANLIITHHPVIFTPIKTVLSDSIVYKCVKNNISVISAHTNLDTAQGGVNDCLANTLELENIEKIICDDGFSIRLGSLPLSMSCKEFAEYCSEKLNIKARYCDTHKPIKTVAVCGGSGGDLLCYVYNKADAFVTADTKHHLFNECENKGLMLLDCGHYNTEDTVIEPLTKVLASEFKDIRFVPFHYYPFKCCGVNE